MSIAAENLPLPRRGDYQKKPPRRDELFKKATAPLPRWYSKKCFDFQGCDWFELEFLLLINQTC